MMLIVFLTEKYSLFFHKLISLDFYRRKSFSASMLLPWPESTLWPLPLFLYKIFSGSIHCSPTADPLTVLPWCLARCCISGFLGYFICRRNLISFLLFLSKPDIFFWKSSVVENHVLQLIFLKYGQINPAHSFMWNLLWLKGYCIYSKGVHFLWNWTDGSLLSTYTWELTYMTMSTSDFKLFEPYPWTSVLLLWN